MAENQIRSGPAHCSAVSAAPRLGAPAQPHQLERRPNPSTTSVDWSPDGTRMGKGISLSGEELAILKGILEDLEL